MITQKYIARHSRNQKKFNHEEHEEKRTKKKKFLQGNTINEISYLKLT